MIELKHFCDVFLKQMQQIEKALIFEVELLLNFNVGVQDLCSDVVIKDLDSRVNEALELVDNHFLLSAQAHILC